MKQNTNVGRRQQITINYRISRFWPLYRMTVLHGLTGSKSSSSYGGVGCAGQSHVCPGKQCLLSWRQHKKILSAENRTECPIPLRAKPMTFLCSSLNFSENSCKFFHISDKYINLAQIPDAILARKIKLMVLLYSHANWYQLPKAVFKPECLSFGSITSGSKGAITNFWMQKTSNASSGDWRKALRLRKIPVPAKMFSHVQLLTIFSCKLLTITPKKIKTLVQQSAPSLKMHWIIKLFLLTKKDLTANIFEHCCETIVDPQVTRSFFRLPPKNVDAPDSRRSTLFTFNATSLILGLKSFLLRWGFPSS